MCKSQFFTLGFLLWPLGTAKQKHPKPTKQLYLLHQDRTEVPKLKAE